MKHTTEPTSLPCDIVRDLLPLYHDGVVSQTTSQAVSRHLEGCPPCRREYDNLCTDLPEEGEDSTRDKFSAMMKKLRRKRIIVTAAAVVVACGLLIGLLAFLWQVPLVDVPAGEVEIAKVCRYEIDGEQKFFILYSTPAYTGYSNGKTYADDQDPSTLVVSRKKTVFARAFQGDLRSEDLWITEAEGPDGAYTTLTFNDQVIWTEEANGNDPVPDYVYAIDDYYSSNQTGASIIDLDQGYLGIFYEDGRRMVWTVEGDLLADDYPDGEGNYPDLSAQAQQ